MRLIYKFKINLWIPPIKLWWRIFYVKHFVKDEFHRYLNIGFNLFKKGDSIKYMEWITRNRNRLHQKDFAEEDNFEKWVSLKHNLNSKKNKKHVFTLSRK